MEREHMILALVAVGLLVAVGVAVTGPGEKATCTTDNGVEFNVPADVADKVENSPQISCLTEDEQRRTR